MPENPAENGSLFDDGHVWERQPGETAKAFVAFEAYRQLPRRERSIRAAYAELCRAEGKTPSANLPGQIGQWAQKYKWPDRAAAYDNYIRRAETDAAAETAAELEKRRKDAEVYFFDKTKDLVDKLFDDYATKLAPTPFSTVKTVKDGKPIEIQGIAPAQKARFIQEIRSTVADLVNGFGMRVSERRDAIGNGGNGEATDGDGVARVVQFVEGFGKED